MQHPASKEEFIAVPASELEVLHKKLAEHKRAYHGPLILLVLALITWFCILLVGCASPQNGQCHITPPVYNVKTALRSVVPVTDEKDRVRATAVVLKCDPAGPDTLVTAQHVLLVMHKVNGKRAFADKFHPTADMMLVHAELGLGCYAAQLGDPQVGEEVLVVGSALGQPDTQTSGHIVQISWGDFWTRKRHRIIYSSALVRPGNSGGAMFDGVGRLVGVVTHFRFKPFSGELIGCADHVQHVRELLSE